MFRFKNIAAFGSNTHTLFIYNIAAYAAQQLILCRTTKQNIRFLTEPSTAYSLPAIESSYPERLCENLG